MNIRQANGIGRVHVAKPQFRETYCGRPINDEDWVTTTREANCTGCARAGAPGLQRTTSTSSCGTASLRAPRVRWMAF
jgi:hypothetical protein